MAAGRLTNEKDMAARILIVEDEEPLTLLLRYNLEAEGFEVDSVARGDDAELHLRDHTPDLVLLDWMLPGLSGIELCRRLRSRRDTERVPIIMLTARGEETERVRGLATGADDYVVKPFCCAGPSPAMWQGFCRQATSSSTARRGVSAAPAANCISGRPSSGCSNS